MRCPAVKCSAGARKQAVESGWIRCPGLHRAAFDHQAVAFEKIQYRVKPLLCFSFSAFLNVTICCRIDNEQQAFKPVLRRGSKAACIVAVLCTKIGGWLPGHFPVVQDFIKFAGIIGREEDCMMGEWKARHSRAQAPGFR